MKTADSETRTTLRQDLAVNWRGVKHIVKLDRWLWLWVAASSAVTAAAPFVPVYFSARLLGELLGNQNRERLLLFGCLLVSLTFLASILKDALWEAADLHFQALNFAQRREVDQAVLTADYKQLENPQLHLKKQLLDDSYSFNGGGLFQLAYQVGVALRCLFLLLYSVFFLLPIFQASPAGAAAAHPLIASPLFPALFLLALVGVSAYTVFADLRYNRGQYSQFSTCMWSNRFGNYYLNQLAGDYQVGKDIRLFGEQPLIQSAIDQMAQTLGRAMTHLSSLQGWCFGSIDTLTALLTGAVYLLTGARALAGLLPVDALVQTAAGIGQFCLAVSLGFGTLVYMRLNTQYLRPYFDFIDFPQSMYKGTIPVEKRDDGEYEIAFDHVSFRYPGSDQWAIKDLSLQLKVGKKLAVVGRNGSGKTTFIKLLCRLYDPTEGRILLNGIDIQKYDYREYLSLFSVVFQDFKLFSFPCAQNVAASVRWDEKAVRRCLEEAGMGDWLDRVPLGTETPLYKNFDDSGVEISGGEAQKIAIARALYKNAPFIVLDEPTAALDPLSEADIYRRFDALTSEKTAVYISHRLSSCRFCQDIAVFDRGQLVERGPHRELLAKGGQYARLWEAQARYYRDDPEGASPPTKSDF